ncbi:hypothetical protein JWH16_04545 [Xanthomonas campestris pv. campestris]|uniref:hypothetical protein n=1 Tax=Xanthomonas campestris TaxID=339 RepID=UPI001E45C6FC|nr:hypothetical protein [Xanthomonas campestris]MCD0253124.1 hypothetical protein [Xanthomonas campestris pv. campestris]
MAATLTLTFNDPQTIALLLQYSKFLKQEEGLDGTLQEIAAGLVVGSLDENISFTQWSKANKPERRQAAAAAKPANVTQLPTAKVALPRATAPLRRATA